MVSFRGNLVLRKHRRKNILTQKFWVGFVTDEDDLQQIYKLRYNDMILEYRPDAVNSLGLDRNEYDIYAKHIAVKDLQTGQIVGYYRMIESADLENGRTFVCEEEYNLDALKARREKICEFSRAVIKKEYRNGMVLMQLWKFILDYMQKNGVRYMVGDASFFGVDRDKYAEEISFLVHNHSADPSLRIVSRDPLGNMTLLASDKYDPKAVFAKLPPLFKAYLMLGAKVGSQPFVDKVFGSVDMFILVDLLSCNEALVRKILSH